MSCWVGCKIGKKGKDCRRCKDNCKGWFPGDKAVMCGCKRKCKSNPLQSRDEYLNEIGRGPAQVQQILNENERTLIQMDLDQDEAMKNIGAIVGAGIGGLILVLMIWAMVKISNG